MKLCGRLRAIGASSESANEAIDLWRGLKNVAVCDEFLRAGGTELAPMSTTSNLEVALKYSVAEQSILLRLHTTSSMERGADLTYLSAFPGEAEYLFKPLTYLQPMGPLRQICLAGRVVTVIDVAPRV